jgi:hypothetical protein
MSKDLPQSDRQRRTFWILGGALAVLHVAIASHDITRPFYGLHSWGLSDGPWYGRCHVRYGLGYTRGVRTQAVGDPPPKEPLRYYDHPQLGALIVALGMVIFGVNVWSQRVVAIIFGVLALMLLLKLLRHLAGARTAILACLLWVLFPITGYFGAGGAVFLTGFLAVWFYLVLIGEIKDGPEPKARHLIGLGVVLLVMTQLAWNCYFWALAIGVHYVFRCIRRRQWPRWALLAVLIAVPLAGGLIMLLIMLVGFDWDFQRIVDLYTWRAARGEMTARMEEFDWIAWFKRFWEFALTNFTFWVLLVAIIGIAQHVARRALRYVSLLARSRPNAKDARRKPPSEAAEPPGLFGGSPQLMLFLMPGVFQLLILRGALWPHQYWERPLAPFIALCAAMALVGLWDLLARFGRYVAVGAVVLAVVLLAIPCYQGTSYYFAIRWQHPDRIKLWQDLNRLIPPEKSLLTYDAALDNLIVTQSKAKGAVIRAEPAWYIDRQIIEAPNRTARVATYRRLGASYLRFVQEMQKIVGDFRSGRTDLQTAQALEQNAQRELQTAVLGVLRSDLPAILAEIEQKRRTGRFPCYLVPGQLYHPRLGPALALYLMGLNAELQKRYPTLVSAPGQKGETKYGKFFKAGMRPYFVYDLSGGTAGS